MATLSNIDIEKELIQGNILVFPFKAKNIKGASYNFTVGQFAYQIPTISNPQFVRAYDPVSKKIKLPAKSTVLVATEESIWVSQKIAGTYHSKVKLVSQGVGHIGTTLDPGYLGVSIIAIHNLSEKDIFLTPSEDTFVSITFHYLKTKSNKDHDNNPGRMDIVGIVKPDPEDLKWLQDEQFRNNKNELKEKLNEDLEFKKLKLSYSRNLQKFFFYIPYVVFIALIILGIYWSSSNVENITFFADKATTVGLTALIAQIIFDIRRNS